MPEDFAFTFIDLFSGIGGLRRAFERHPVGGRCVFSSEWDLFARQTYEENFGVGEHEFAGDICGVSASSIPDHDVLVGGFPCQPFSLAGVSKKNSLGRAHGFEDETQGTLFFEILRIITKKRPPVLFLENVPNLQSHDGGKTFSVIRRRLEGLGYRIESDIVDARSWVPQGRRRIIIVGFRRDLEKHARAGASLSFRVSNYGRVRKKSHWIDGHPVMLDVLHRRGEDRDRLLGPAVLPSREPASAWYTDRHGVVNPKYTISDGLWEYLEEYAAKHRAAGHGFGFGLVGPHDVARTLSARYYKDGSEILVRQSRGRNPRRLTPRECARLMGFPDSFRIPVSDNQAYKQFGNSVVVPMMAAIARALKPSILELSEVGRRSGRRRRS